MYFEDLEVGQVLTTRKRVVTGTEFDIFATMTGAVNPLFVSKSFAVSAKLRDRVSPGLLTMGWVFGSLYQVGLFDHIVALTGIDKLRFLLPVHPDDTLESKATVQSKSEDTEHQERGIVVFAVSCTNQENREVLRGELRFLFRRTEKNVSTK